MPSTLGSWDLRLLFTTLRGDACHGTTMSVARQAVVFEVYHPHTLLQLSEVLPSLRLQRGERVLYDGKAVVCAVLHTGTSVIATATLVDAWQADAEPWNGRRVVAEVGAFIQDWQAARDRLVPGYIMAISALRCFLDEVRRCLPEGPMAPAQGPGAAETAETAEGAESAGAAESAPAVQTPACADPAPEIEAVLAPRFEALTAAFEDEARRIPGEASGLHASYARRALHPLLLCAPFVHRTYRKPLGYAGDYEMVNMILRPAWEGASLYARVVNALNLRTPPAAAHRHRIDLLVEHLQAERRRCAGDRILRVLNLACGPAAEIQRFIRQDPEAAGCAFTLLDVNDETLRHAEERIRAAMRASGRSPALQLIRRPIQDLLREAAGRSSSGDWRGAYDVIYCAGLFDYLSDRICQRLLQLFAGWLAPGGSLVVTNVHRDNPHRLYMEHILEWHLQHRDAQDLLAMAPSGLIAGVGSDRTGLNLFLRCRASAAPGAAHPDGRPAGAGMRQAGAAAPAAPRPVGARGGRCQVQDGRGPAATYRDGMVRSDAMPQRGA